MTQLDLEAEICAIEAIFPESVEKHNQFIYSFKVPSDGNLSVQISFPDVYPEEKPTIIQIYNKDTRKYTDIGYIERQCQDILNDCYNIGDVCIFEFLTGVDSFVAEYSRQKQEECRRNAENIVKVQNKNDERSRQLDVEKKIQHLEIVDANIKRIDYLKDWYQSEPIVDRGSTFIGYAAEAFSVKEAQEKLEVLLQDRRISRSAHHMNAWRIKGEGNVQYQDSDDDGETAAGSRMLHLLQMMDAWNVIVVVVRWFGGTHIGPDRFKHINSATREAIIKGKFVILNENKNARKKGK